MKIEKSNTIAEVMHMDAEKATPVFFSFGMHCLYCPMSSHETLEQAGGVHGIDVDVLVSALNEAVCGQANDN